MIHGWEHAVIAACIGYILHVLINKNKTAKRQEEILAKGCETKEGDWESYLAKLCRITGKNAHELMYIAAQESGLNYSKSRISQDFRALVRTGELPYYVIRFLEKGKDHIDSINDGPECKTQMPGMF
jgi:hypothetical protein